MRHNLVKERKRTDCTNLDEHERIEHLALQRRGAEDALDLRRGEVGEVHSPPHGAAGLPLQLVAALLEGAGVWIVGVILGVGGQRAACGSESARVAAGAR